MPALLLGELTGREMSTILDEESEKASVEYALAMIAFIDSCERAYRSARLLGVAYKRATVAGWKAWLS